MTCSMSFPWRTSAWNALDVYLPDPLACKRWLPPWKPRWSPKWIPVSRQLVVYTWFIPLVSVRHLQMEGCCCRSASKAPSAGAATSGHGSRVPLCRSLSGTDEDADTCVSTLRVASQVCPRPNVRVRDWLCLASGREYLCARTSMVYTGVA